MPQSLYNRVLKHMGVGYTSFTQKIRDEEKNGKLGGPEIGILFLH